jgi:hypothetical protein
MEHTCPKCGDEVEEAGCFCDYCVKQYAEAKTCGEYRK